MKKITILVDGYNLYHAIDSLNKPHLKWINPKQICRFFIQSKIEKINKVKFFTAFPKHKSLETQQRYQAFIGALKHFDIEVIEGKFKKKIVKYKDENGKFFTKISHEEKESDVNLALAILEDSFENISDKILVITNDSDISPAIRMARKKNANLKINIVTPPLVGTKKANYDLLEACGNINKNKQGQVYFKTNMIREFALDLSRLPEEIIANDGAKILMPENYRRAVVAPDNKGFGTFS